ncbi:MAG: hypothetical protein E6Q25_03475 [Acinetobacter sp.]|jgi:hypothetical protein|nr:MAG: hypothetical protein E6Q25_03475 [Acinetobacter sp.]
MLKNMVLVMLLATSLTGCSKSDGVQSIKDFFAKIMNSEKQENQPTSQSKFNREQLALLQDISGIWRSDASELVSILIQGEHIIFMIDNEPKEASIGEVDTVNGIVNLKMIEKYSNEDVIWTIRKSVINEKGDFTLKVITHEGESYDLSFVRNISETDKNRIMKIVNHFQESDEQIEEEVYQLEEVHADASADVMAAEAAEIEEIERSATEATEVAQAAAQAATAQEMVTRAQKIAINDKTEKLHLYDDVQSNNGMLSVTTNKGFSTWQVNNLSAAAANTLIGLSSGQCFNLVSKKGFNQTDGRDIQSVYQVAC